MLILMIVCLGVTANAQELCIIVNKENTTANMSMNNLRRIYLSMKMKWSNNKKIITTIFPIGAQERDFFITAVLGFKPDDFLVYYDNEKMKGNIVAKPIVLNNDLAIQRFIEKNPNAIGFVNTNSVDTSMVKVIKIDGFSPGDEKYPIRK